MKTRFLKDIEVSEVGMGCMAFSHGYGKIPSETYMSTAALSLTQLKFTVRISQGSGTMN